MKRTIQRHEVAMIPIVAILFLTTSCIYDVPGDRFCRTLWTTSESPLEGLTLEFLCDGWISAQSPEASSGSYGHYQPHDMTAYFTGLTITYEDCDVVIEEAHRTDDLLLISWHLAEDEKWTPNTDSDRNRPEGTHPGLSYTTRLHRIQTYL